MKAISIEEIDNMVLTFFIEYNRAPKFKEFGPSKGFGLCSYKTITNKKENIESICKRINIPINKKTTTYSDEEIYTLFSDFFEKNNRAPYKYELTKQLPCDKTIAHLGGITGICTNLNIPLNKIFYTKEYLITEMIDYCNVNNTKYIPSQETIEKTESLAAYTTYYTHIGSIAEIAKACNLKYKDRKVGFGYKIIDKKYGTFSSKIEYSIFLCLITYILPENIDRQKKYNELFNTKTMHTADFYIEKLGIVVEATNKKNSIPRYERTKEWKKSLSDNVYFVYCSDDVDNLMKELGVNKLE